MSGIKEISEESLREIEKKVKEKYEKSGFSTEEEVALTLAKAGWAVIRNVKYYHQTEKKYKEIDLIGIKMVSNKSRYPVRLLLIIECKKQEDVPWIFPMGNLRITDPFSVTFVAKEQVFDSIYKKIEKRFDKHYYYNRPAVTFHLSPFYILGDEKDKIKKVDPIKKAIDQVLDGLIETASSEEKLIERATLVASFFYPVIVLNGNLLSYSEEKLTVESHISYLTNISLTEPWPIAGKIKRYKPLVIDVVKLPYLEEFLKIVETRGVLI